MVAPMMQGAGRGAGGEMLRVSGSAPTMNHRGSGVSDVPWAPRANGHAEGLQRAASLLEHHPLTQAVAAETRSMLARSSAWREVEAGAPLFGAAEEAVAFVEAGAVRVYDQTWLVGYRGKRDLVGVEILGGLAWGARAMTAVVVLVVPAAALFDLSGTDPGLRKALNVHWASCVADAQAGRRLALYGTVRQRLAAFLLEAADRWGAPAVGGVRLDAPLTQQEVAAAIGAERKMVSRTLGALQTEGAVARAGRKALEILVLDRAKLEAAAHLGPDHADGPR